MAFNKRPTKEAVPTDPAHLYRMLATQHPNAPENLWYHQGEVLSSWHTKHHGESDVALELPTGAGKTLVGGVIAEFQRRTANERTAYLCPTRQLARQTAERLNTYGIPAVALTGKARDWPDADTARYRSGMAVAVTTYAHVFNAYPAIDDAQLLILDDAHAAADAVASPWTLNISRRDHHFTYMEVIGQLSEGLDPLVVTRLGEDSADQRYRTSTYLASPVAVRATASEIGKILRGAASVPEYAALSKSATYTLRLIEDHLEACLFYVSHREISIRPLIPPTANHPAFDTPARRIYMSATLGAGGELERAFGRRKITRIPIPAGWEKQGTGRRLFCVPDLTSDMSGNSPAVAEWVKSEITRHGRAVLLTPDGRTASQVTAVVVPTGTPTLTANQVEDDLKVFTNQEKAVLVLTNRYDGIDLPDNDCRLVILAGFPTGGDLQEKFLYSSLGAHEVLQERIRARLAQGAGRATRNARDYATVIVLGTNLIKFATRSDVRSAMHPEIHAELEFGWLHSMDTSSAEMSENIDLFLEHDDDWRVVDTDIANMREDVERRDPPGTAELAAAARAEVAAWDALWAGEIELALTQAKAVIDAIGGARAPQRYAAMWNYFAACWTSKLASKATTVEAAKLEDTIRTYYKAARACGRGTTWLSHLASPADEVPTPAATELDNLDAAAVQGVLTHLPNRGKQSKFAPLVEELRTDVRVADAIPFENALVTIGTLLGASASFGNGGASAAPDAVWMFGNQMWVSLEAKSEASPTGETGATYVRQASDHLRYTSNDRREPIPGGSVGFLVTPEATVHSAGVKLAEPHLYRLRPDRMVDLADRAIRAWGVMRAMPGIAEDGVAKVLRDERLLPSQWAVDLCTEAVADL